MSYRLFIGLLAAGFALSASEACNHAGSNGSTGTAGTGSTGTGNGSGQAGTGSGNAGTSGGAGTFGDTGAAGTATGTGNNTGTAGRTASGNVGTTGGAGNAEQRGGGGTGSSLEGSTTWKTTTAGSSWRTAARDRGTRSTIRTAATRPPLGTGCVATAGGATTPQRRAHDRQRLQFGGVGLDLNNSTGTPSRRRAWLQRQRVHRPHVLGEGRAARCASSSRCGHSSPRTAAARAPATAGTCTAPTTPSLSSNWTQVTITFAGMRREQAAPAPRSTRPS